MFLNCNRSNEQMEWFDQVFNASLFIGKTQSPNKCKRRWKSLYEQQCRLNSMLNSIQPNNNRICMNCWNFHLSCVSPTFLSSLLFCNRYTKDWAFHFSFFFFHRAKAPGNIFAVATWFCSEHQSSIFSWNSNWEKKWKDETFPFYDKDS